MSEGGKLRLIAGRRTPEEQDSLHREKPDLALPADRSPHVRGEGADVSGDIAVLARNLKLLGDRVYRPYPEKEPWHFQLRRKGKSNV